MEIIVCDSSQVSPVRIDTLGLAMNANKNRDGETRLYWERLEGFTHTRWLIDRPINGRSRVYGNASPEEARVYKYCFRLKDADGKIYAYGHSSRENFVPLDEYGRALGCVTIEYMNNGKWCPL